MELKIEIEKRSGKRIRLIIEGQDYTLGNLLQEALLRDDRVEGAGFYITHPLIKKMILEIRFKSEVNDPLSIIIEDINKFKTDLLNIRELILKIVGDKRD